MAEDPDEAELEELRALMARNSEAIEKLRTMLERLELTLTLIAANASETKPEQKPAPPPAPDDRATNGDAPNP